MTECGYKDCRVPESRHNSCAAEGLGKCWPEFNWVTAYQLGRGQSNLQNQHTPKRSQGGKECHVVLCAGHHGDIDNGGRRNGLRIRDRVRDCKDWGLSPGRRYEIYDRESGEVLMSLRLEDSDMGGGEPINPDDGAALAGTPPPSLPGASD